MAHVATQNETQTAYKRRDLHELVTNTIIEQLEAGTVPWHKPWKGDDNRAFDIPKNFTTGKHYRGVNILMLWCATIGKEFKTSEWATFNQWADKKEMIRKGEKGSLIVYYDTFEKEVEGEVKEIPFLKSSVVFNRCQLASYQPPAVEEEQQPIKPLVERIEYVDTFINQTQANIQHKGGRACYVPSLDEIHMPTVDAFVDTKACTATEGYYSTLLHELTHWTGNEQRLKRQGGKKFGDQNYATEELVAELGAAFLCAEFDISVVEKGNHASYVASWLKALKDNKQCIFTAASEASKAVDYLKTLQPQPG